MGVTTFFNAVNGGTVILPSGRIKNFFGGYCEVEEGDDEALTVLTELAKNPQTGISLQQATAVPPPAIAAAASAVADNAAKVAENMAAAAKK